MRVANTQLQHSQYEPSVEFVPRARTVSRYPAINTRGAADFDSPIVFKVEQANPMQFIRSAHLSMPISALFSLGEHDLGLVIPDGSTVVCQHDHDVIMRAGEDPVPLHAAWEPVLVLNHLGEYSLGGMDFEDAYEVVRAPDTRGHGEFIVERRQLRHNELGLKTTDAREIGFRNRQDKCFQRVEVKVNQLTSVRYPERQTFVEEHLDRDVDTYYSQPDNGDCISFCKGRGKSTHDVYHSGEKVEYPPVTDAAAENTGFLRRVRRFQEGAVVHKGSMSGSCKLEWNGRVNIPLQCGVFQPYQTRKKVATGNSLSSKYVPFVRSLYVQYDFRQDTTRLDAPDTTNNNAVGKMLFQKQSILDSLAKEDFQGGKTHFDPFYIRRFSFGATRYGCAVFIPLADLNVNSVEEGAALFSVGDRMQIAEAHGGVYETFGNDQVNGQTDASVGGTLDPTVLDVVQSWSIESIIARQNKNQTGVDTGFWIDVVAADIAGGAPFGSRNHSDASDFKFPQPWFATAAGADIASTTLDTVTNTHIGHWFPSILYLKGEQGVEKPFNFLGKPKQIAPVLFRPSIQLCLTSPTRDRLTNDQWTQMLDRAYTTAAMGVTEFNNWENSPRIKVYAHIDNRGQLVDFCSPPQCLGLIGQIRASYYDTLINPVMDPDYPGELHRRYATVNDCKGRAVKFMRDFAAYGMYSNYVTMMMANYDDFRQVTAHGGLVPVVNLFWMVEPRNLANQDIATADWTFAAADAQSALGDDDWPGAEAPLEGVNDAQDTGTIPGARYVSQAFFAHMDQYGDKMYVDSAAALVALGAGGVAGGDALFDALTGLAPAQAPQVSAQHVVTHLITDGTFPQTDADILCFCRQQLLNHMHAIIQAIHLSSITPNAIGSV